MSSNNNYYLVLFNCNNYYHDHYALQNTCTSYLIFITASRVDILISVWQMKKLNLRVIRFKGGKGIGDTFIQLSYLPKKKKKREVDWHTIPQGINSSSVTQAWVFWFLAGSFVHPITPPRCFQSLVCERNLEDYAFVSLRETSLKPGLHAILWARAPIDKVSSF